MPSKIKNWQFIQMPKLHVSGITLFPFIVIKHNNLRLDKSFINHEHIHLASATGDVGDSFLRFLFIALPN
jgi:hypothetical protein